MSDRQNKATRAKHCEFDGMRDEIRFHGNTPLPLRFASNSLSTLTRRVNEAMNMLLFPLLC